MKSRRNILSIKDTALSDKTATVYEASPVNINYWTAAVDRADCNVCGSSKAVGIDMN